MAQREKRFAAAFGCQHHRTVTSANMTPTLPPNEDQLFEQIARHLSGEVRMGLVTPSMTGDVYWAMIAIDEESVPADNERWEAVVKIKQALSIHGIACYVERGKSLGKGDYQIWLFLETPMAAGGVSETLGGLLADLDLFDYSTLIPTTSHEYGHLFQVAWLPLFGGNEDAIAKKRGGGVPTGRTVFLGDDQSVVSDQWKIIAGIKRVSAASFEALELATMPYQSNWQDLRAGYAGGPEELQTVLDNCPFVKWCEEQKGEIPIPLRMGLLSNLCRFGQAGSKKIVELLGLTLKGTNMLEVKKIGSQIARMFRTAGPITYAAIKRLGWPGVIPVWPDSPAGWGLYLDLDRLIKEFAALTASPRRLDDALTNHFRQDFFRLPVAKQEHWLQCLAKETGIPYEELDKRARKSFDKIELRGWDLGALLDQSKRFDYTPEQQGNLMYRWLLANGGKVFVDQHNTYYTVWRGQEAELGKGKAFEALLYEATRMTLSTPKMRRVIRAFQAGAYYKALKIDQLAWIQTDGMSFTVYLHLNSRGKGIIRLDPTGVTEIPNATNEMDVFLARSPKMQEWDLLNLSAQEYKDGLRRFDELVLKNMACAREDQLLYGCWALCYPLIGFVMSRPHLRAEGISGSGKTRAMDLIGHFVYGKQQLITPTEAANIAGASTNPLVLLDNIESRDLKPALQNFMLWAVSGAQKEKRKAGTASDIIEELICCLVNTTGIENLNKTELINRTIHIEFDKSLQAKGGLPKTVYDDIRNDRSLLMTAHMLLVARILGRIASGEWKSKVDKLISEHPKFILERSNEYIALMVLAAEELLPAIAPKTNIDKLIETWIQTQNKYAAATASESNPLVGLINAIFADKAHHDALAKPGKWPYELPCDGASLHGSAAELHRTFLAAKGRHKLPYEYKTESTLSRRIKDSAEAFDGAGYDVSWKQDRHRKHLVFTITKRMPGKASITTSRKRK